MVALLPSGCRRRARSSGPRSTSTPTTTGSPRTRSGCAARCGGWRSTSSATWSSPRTRAASSRPSRFEVQFGNAEDPHPPLELDGGALRLAGRIDRVDTDGREAIVYDYKGKTATEQAKWLEKGKLQIGLYMMALKHVLGLEPVGGFYQPLGGAEARPRGALLRDADPGLAGLQQRPPRRARARRAAARLRRRGARPRSTRSATARSCPSRTSARTRAAARTRRSAAA